MNYNILNHISSFFEKHEIWKIRIQIQLNLPLLPISQDDEIQIHTWIDKYNRKIRILLTDGIHQVFTNFKCHVFYQQEEISFGLLNDNSFQMNIPDELIHSQITLQINTLDKNINWKINLNSILIPLNLENRYVIWETKNDTGIHFRCYFRFVKDRYQISHPWVSFNKYYLLSLCNKFYADKKM